MGFPSGVPIKLTSLKDNLMKALRDTTKAIIVKGILDIPYYDESCNVHTSRQ